MTQAIRSPPAEPVCRAMSAETIKIPDPIIEPTTIMVESKRPSPRIKPDSVAMGSGEVTDVAGDVFTVSPSILFAGARSFSEISLGASGRILCGNQVARHGQGIGAGAKSNCGAFEGDAANGDERFAGMAASLTQQIQSDHGIRIFLGGCRENRAESDVVRGSLIGLVQLRERVCGYANPSVWAHDGARLCDTKILLSHVHSPRFH